MKLPYIIAVGLVVLGLGIEGAKHVNIDWPPAPVPDEPDIPPEPVDPPGPLTPLVPEEHRPLVVQFFTDMASMVEADTAGVLDSTDKIRQAQQAASRLLVQAGRLPANELFRAELERRQKLAMGEESQPVTPVIRAQVVQFYRQVAEDI